MAQFKRYDLLPAAVNRGVKAGRVSNNRKSSDKYHAQSPFPKLPGSGRGGAGKGLVRLARRSNNGNMPGHGVGGVPGNGLGGGLPSMHGLLHGLLKNHKAMSAAKNVHFGGGGIRGGAGIPAPKLPNTPIIKAAKPLPIRKIPKPPPVKQPKLQTSVKLPPLGSARSTRPSFSKNTGSNP